MPKRAAPAPPPRLPRRRDAVIEVEDDAGDDDNASGLMGGIGGADNAVDAILEPSRPAPLPPSSSTIV